MKRSIKALLVLALASTAVSQGLSINYTGNKAYAMGGAFRAVADDYSAFFWNPAGLTKTENATFGMSGIYVLPSASITPTEASMHGTEKREVEDRKFFIPTVGYFRTNGNLTYGLGINAPFGLGATWDIIQPYKNNAFESTDKNEYDTDLNVINVQPTIAYKINEKLSVGFGVSYLHTNIKMKTPSLIDLNAKSAKLAGGVQGAIFQGAMLAHAKLTADQFNALPDAQKTGMVAAYKGNTEFMAGVDAAYENNYRYTWMSQNLDGSGNGFGVSGGITYKATDRLTVGANFRWYAEQSLSGNIKANIIAHNETTLAAGLKSGIEGAIASGDMTLEEGTEAIKSISALYGLAGANPEALKDKVEAKLNLPMDFGVGVAYQATDALLISADVNMTKWSSLDKIDLDLKDNADSKLELQWKDVIRYSLGLDWKATKAMELMAGFYMTDTPTDDSTFDPSIPDLNNRMEYAFGVKYHLSEQLGLEVSAAHIAFADREIATSAQNGLENVSGNYSGSVNEIAVGFTYDF